MGLFGGKGSGSSGGSGGSDKKDKTPTNRDPYVSGNRDDWNRRPASDGETVRKPKKK